MWLGRPIPGELAAKVETDARDYARFTGLRIAATYAVIGAVFGEWVGASQGLGYLILVFNNQTDTAAVFAAVTVLAVIGIGLFALISLVERLALPWYHKPRSQGNAV